MAKEAKTFKDLIDIVIERGRLDDNSATRTILKEKLNTIQQDLAFAESYKWSGRTDKLNLEAKYITGTVSVTSASYIVTGTSTVWTRFHEGWKFRITGGDTIYEVKYVDTSAQTLTLDGPFSET